MQRRQHITHRRVCELHPALGALSWLGVSQSLIAKHLRGDKGGTASQATVSLWYLCTKAVPAEFHTPLWNLARISTARTAELALLAIRVRPDLHHDPAFLMSIRCARRAYRITFGFPSSEEDDGPEATTAEKLEQGAAT